MYKIINIMHPFCLILLRFVEIDETLIEIKNNESDEEITNNIDFLIKKFKIAHNLCLDLKINLMKKLIDKIDQWDEQNIKKSLSFEKYEIYEDAKINLKCAIMLYFS